MPSLRPPRPQWMRRGYQIRANRGGRAISLRESALGRESHLLECPALQSFSQLQSFCPRTVLSSGENPEKARGFFYLAAGKQLKTGSASYTKHSASNSRRQNRGSSGGSSLHIIYHSCIGIQGLRHSEDGVRSGRSQS